MRKIKYFICDLIVWLSVIALCMSVPFLCASLFLCLKTILLGK